MPVPGDVVRCRSVLAAALCQGLAVRLWFMTASFETLCVSSDGHLKPFLGTDGYFNIGSPIHCVDDGPGSYGSDGYNRAAKTFAQEIADAARNQGWSVEERIDSRPIATVEVNGKKERIDHGEDGVKFNGEVYVLTISQ